MSIYNYSLYWIKHKDHKDPKTQGYIGISNNPKRRFKQHQRRQNHPVSNAIKKYGEDVDIFVLQEGLSEFQAKKLEESLRPKMRIGWNIMTGGNVPPSSKGTVRKDLSEKFSGKGNPFYGKRHTDSTKNSIRESMSGENNPNFGLKRPEHSRKLKQKRGKKYPKFRGYFITPFGKYESFEDACNSDGIKVSTLYKYCIYSNESAITNLAYSKSIVLKKVGKKEDVVGKTYKDVGFDYEYE